MSTGASRSASCADIRWDIPAGTLIAHKLARVFLDTHCGRCKGAAPLLVRRGPRNGNTAASAALL
jgi:hypothetical protein